jgi:hypothetical protein
MRWAGHVTHMADKRNAHVTDGKMRRKETTRKIKT